MINQDSTNMNSKYLVVVAAMAIMLIGATAFTTNDAFSDKEKKHYVKSQAAAQANYCGNGELPLNVFCQNLDAQLQGDGNAVNIIGAQ
jgi:hypothetical protein